MVASTSLKTLIFEVSVTRRPPSDIFANLIWCRPNIGWARVVVYVRRTTARGYSSGAGLHLRGSPVPRQEFIDAIDWMIGDAGDDIGEPSFWIDFV